jgi:hypothetical protein
MNTTQIATFLAALLDSSDELTVTDVDTRRLRETL